MDLQYPTFNGLNFQREIQLRNKGHKQHYISTIYQMNLTIYTEHSTQQQQNIHNCEIHTDHF